MVRRTPKRQFVRILLSPKIEYLLYKPPYLTGIEGPPPKRNAVGSNPIRDAKTTGFHMDIGRFFSLCSMKLFIAKVSVLLF